MKYSEIKEGLGDIPGNVIDKLQAKTGMAGPTDVGGTKDKTDKKDKDKNKNDKQTPLRKLKTGTKFKDSEKRIWVYSSEKQIWYDVDDNQKTLDANSGYKLLQRAKQKAVVTESVLKESGNVFKTEPEKKLIASRIATADVQPTIDWLNKTFGFKFTPKDFLGTTGTKTHPDGTFKKNSSGDLDLNTDTRELPKEEIIAKLSAWCQKQGIPDLEIMNKGKKFEAGWIKDAGLQVHFRTPIKGNPKNGFVQTDFMLTDNPDLQRGAKRGGTENYTGADRAVFLSSIARARGYKFSPTKGVVDPNNGDAVVANDWNEIAKILLGPNAKESDTHTVESMLEIIIKLPEYEDLVAQARESGIDVPNKGEL